MLNCMELRKLGCVAANVNILVDAGPAQGCCSLWGAGCLKNEGVSSGGRAGGPALPLGVPEVPLLAGPPPSAAGAGDVGLAGLGSDPLPLRAAAAGCCCCWMPFSAAGAEGRCGAGAGGCRCAGAELRCGRGIWLRGGSGMEGCGCCGGCCGPDWCGVTPGASLMLENSLCSGPSAAGGTTSAKTLIDQVIPY